MRHHTTGFQARKSGYDIPACVSARLADIMHGPVRREQDGLILSFFIGSSLILRQSYASARHAVSCLLEFLYNVNPSVPGRTVSRNTSSFRRSEYSHHACKSIGPASIHHAALILPTHQPPTPKSALLAMLSPALSVRLRPCAGSSS
jgi:hypothetical protein